MSSSGPSGRPGNSTFEVGQFEGATAQYQRPAEPRASRAASSSAGPTQPRPGGPSMNSATAPPQPVRPARRPSAPMPRRRRPAPPLRIRQARARRPAKPLARSRRIPVGRQSLERGLADVLVAGPLGELAADHQLGTHPAGRLGTRRPQAGRLVGGQRRQLPARARRWAAVNPVPLRRRGRARPRRRGHQLQRGPPPGAPVRAGSQPHTTNSCSGRAFTFSQSREAGAGLVACRRLAITPPGPGP